MCTGTGYVARRSALAEVEGWPLAYSGEDYMCSTLLSGAGWRIAFVREPLQAGLAPESLESLLKQRMRWVGLLTSAPVLCSRFALLVNILFPFGCRAFWGHILRC